jgi:hypothetical protein
MPANTIFNASDRAALRTRLSSLPAAATPAWGKMSCEQMLAHLSAGVRMALGELPVRPKGPRILSLAPLRHAMIHWVPFPKGAPTAPELLAPASGTHQQEVATLEALLEHAGSNQAGVWASAHPVFGGLTVHDWGVLVYKHVDHHLHQFRV